MESKTDRVFANDPRFFGKTDSETVQNAIDYASAHGIGKVVIPSENERAGTDVWIIDRAILLPSRLTVELDGARLRLADGVRDNIFRNQNGCTEIGRTVEGNSGIFISSGKTAPRWTAANRTECPNACAGSIRESILP